ncbi:probable tubulin polyglutamylase TTLL9 isoform X1 [Halyomorpha halys]|uniref:probable tubulin polyglutamylase TTLL9 isoform X1 n=1 Tax=Halyomorpha halys TaxID=286706 RepID=UPI0006D52248|nr:probable tubulin polyglutamylase TTLL9 isoform X1 [Halyomorpha halys]
MLDDYKKSDNQIVWERNKQGLKLLRYKAQSASIVVREVLRDRGWNQVEGESNIWDLNWCDLGDIQNVLKSRLGDNQYVPNFWNFYELSRKTLLNRNMNKLKKAHLREGRTEEAKLCDCIPVSFELPAQYMMFVDEHKKHSGQTWIVKPAIGSRGKGIFLFRKLKDLNKWKAGKDFLKVTEGEETMPDIWLVQKYIDNPYLLGGKKFDLRLYVLVQSFSPLKVWVNREGFARMSGTTYDLSELKDNYIHLTNASLQLNEKCVTLDNHKQGQKWHIRKLREMLTARHGWVVVENLVQQLGHIILTSLFSVQKNINQNRHSFELFGYDILLDDKLNPWLLEVNSRPALESTDEEDHDLKYNMISDVLNVVDFEGRMSGSEIRIGGFDLIYDGAPIPMPCPGSNECGPFSDVNRLNIFLGALNDREKHLASMREWQNLLPKKC